MSKIITYTLEADGTVPVYILDGGYFPTPSGQASPRDWTLVGVSTDAAPGEGFFDAAAIETYLVSIGGESWTNPDGSPVDLAAQAAAMWERA